MPPFCRWLAEREMSADEVDDLERADRRRREKDPDEAYDDMKETERDEREANTQQHT